jgi:hypothetical protein
MKYLFNRDDVRNMIGFSEAKTKMEGILQSWGIKNRLAFTALLIGGIMAIMIGSVLLVVSYVVINAVIGSAGTITNPALCVSFASTVGQIVQALGIVGIALVVTGIAVIVYVLIGLGGTGMGPRQR